MAKKRIWTKTILNDTSKNKLSTSELKSSSDSSQIDDRSIRALTTTTTYDRTVYSGHYQGGSVAVNPNIGPITPPATRTIVEPIPDVYLAPEPPPPQPGRLSPMEKIVYTDYAFGMEQPLSWDDTAAAKQLSGLYFEYESVYNFFIRDYEKVLAQLPEALLPNLYVFLTEMNRSVRDPGTIISGLPYAFPGSGIYFNHITLGGRIKDTLIDITNEKGEKVGELDRLSYHEEWSKAIGSILPRPVQEVESTPDQAALARGGFFGFNSTRDIIDFRFSGLSPAAANAPAILDYFVEFPFLNSFKNIIIPGASVPYLSDVNDKQKMFPMNINVEFNTDCNTKFADALLRTNMTTTLIKEVLENKEMFVSRYEGAGAFTPGQPLFNPVYEERPWNRWIKMDRVSNVDPTFAGLTDGYYRYWDIGQFLMTKQAADLLQDPTPVSPGGGEDWIYLYSPTLETFDELATAIENCTTTSAINIDTLKVLIKNLVIGQGHASKSKPGLARTYKDVYEGKKAYSETLFYRIQKRNRNTGEIVQNIWIPNSSEIDVVKYVDTQVLYGVEYKYDVFAYQFVVGTKYRYKINNMPLCSDGEKQIFSEEQNTSTGSPSAVANRTAFDSGIPGLEQPVFPQTPPSPTANAGESESHKAKDWATFVNQTFNSNQFTEVNEGPSSMIYSESPQDALDYNKAEICVLSEPSLVLMEVPHFEFDAIVLDKPPVPPDVNLVPYRANSNEMLILLNGSVGKFKAPFITMSDQDEELLRKYLVNQKLPRTQTPAPPIEFSSDDPVTMFEVWRTDQKPTKWTDFKFHALADSSIYFDNPCLKASSAHIKDDVKPNQKYWYTFRSVDVHGNTSNPTAVYEIRMNDDNGTVWLDIETFPAPVPPDLRVPTKAAKRYIQIKPSFNQGALNEVESGLMNQETNQKIPSLATVNADSNKPVFGFTDQDQSVWSSDEKPKKFKIRLTSKKTGRKMDFNVYFATEHIKNPSNKDC